MLRKMFISTILILIIATTFIKNHTKKLDDEIFSFKENINYLNSIKELVQLEYEYLSSPAKLSKLKKLYFEDELQFTSRENIKIINNINEINLETFEKNE